MIKAKKSLGQNFLIDRRFAERIVDAVAPTALDAIIEIGPGTGALTSLLTQRGCHVIAIEIDRHLADELTARLGRRNLSVLNQDALDVDWSELTRIASLAVSEAGGGGDARVRVVANLPYYISKAIVERMLVASRGRLFDMTLMLQKEVVDRIASGPGSRDYGSLSVLVRYYSEPTKLFEVPPSAFKPEPKVQSAVVRLRVRERPAVRVEDEQRFFALVRAAFAHRRKTIANNLRAAALELRFAAPIEAALSSASIEPGRRAETLSLVEFAALDAALYRE